VRGAASKTAPMGREVGSWMRDVWRDAREFRHCRKASLGRDASRWDNHTCTMASRSLSTDGTHGVGAGNGVKRRRITSFAKFLTVHTITVRFRARHPRCGNQRLESRVRENRQHGSEGGEARAFPTPYRSQAAGKASDWPESRAAWMAGKSRP